MGKKGRDRRLGRSPEERKKRSRISAVFGKYLKEEFDDTAFKFLYIRLKKNAP